MTVASVVADSSSFALVHLPVTNEVVGRRILRDEAVSQSGHHIVSLVPKEEFVDGTLLVLTHCERSTALVFHDVLCAEECDGLSIAGNRCAQLTIREIVAVAQ